MAALHAKIDAWRSTIDVADRAAWNKPGAACLSAYMLLGGFAVENLAKGHLVRQLRPSERERVMQGELPEILKGHEIPRLVKDTGYAASGAEQTLLHLLEHTVVWRGRYRIPTSARKLSPGMQSTSDAEQLQRFITNFKLFIATPAAA